MSSIPGVLTALEAAVQTVAGLSWDELPIRDRLQALDRVEAVRRRISAAGLDLIGSIERSGDPALGGAAAKIIADVVRVSPTEARRRIRDAGQLQPRTSLTGQCLPPALPGTAEAWNAGLLDIEHLRVIQKFVTDLPDGVHPDAAAKPSGSSPTRRPNCAPISWRNWPIGWPPPSTPTAGSPTSTGPRSAVSSGAAASASTG